MSHDLNGSSTSAAIACQLETVSNATWDLVAGVTIIGERLKRLLCCCTPDLYAAVEKNKKLDCFLKPGLYCYLCAPFDPPRENVLSSPMGAAKLCIKSATLLHKSDVAAARGIRLMGV